MARRATSLGPKPSFFCFVFVFFGGFKGQVRWPKGPPHLALNPPYLFLFVVFLFCLFFWLFSTKKPCFSPRKGHFLFIFSVSLSFSLSLVWPPSFCVSLSLSLFYLLFFLSSFLSLFLLSFGSLFLSLFFFFFLLCFSFMKGTTAKNQLQVFSSSIFYICWVSCLFFFQVPFSYLCCLVILSYVFLFNIKVFGFKTDNLKKQNYLVKRGVATKRVFYQPLFCKMWKFIVFFVPLFWANFGWCSKSTKKICISAHF